MSTRTTLILHGWGGNKESHWQERLAETLIAAGAPVVYPKMPDPAQPMKDAWLDRYAEVFDELSELGDSLTVVAHSLGAITFLHHVARVGHQIADRALLVAPPYVMPDAPPWSAPESVGAFFPPPLDAVKLAHAVRETHLVGGNDDDYATWEQMETYARRLEIPATCLKGAGHISPYWGYGDWPWVAEWCLGRADLPPLPKPHQP